MSGADAIVPKGEALRRAVRWISEQGCWSSQVIEEASLRFNLSPRDEEFLLEHFVRNPPRSQNAKTPGEDQGNGSANASGQDPL